MHVHLQQHVVDPSPAHLQALCQHSKLLWPQRLLPHLHGYRKPCLFVAAVDVGLHQGQTSWAAVTQVHQKVNIWHLWPQYVQCVKVRCALCAGVASDCVKQTAT